MQYTRLYTGRDRKSHFEDIEIPLKIAVPGRLNSEVTKATGIFFRESRPGLENDWHHPTHRQFVITLAGEADVIASDGTTRRFGPGDVFLAEDLTGDGHITQVVEGKPWQVIFVPLE